MKIPLKQLKILNTKCPICNKLIIDDEYYKKKALWHKMCYKSIEKQLLSIYYGRNILL